MTDFSNKSPAEIAAKFINSTKKHVFLTGKAGSGKTTFLRNIVQKTHKQTIIAAPTGIAAINAGGVTLHSLFQLPFGGFVPNDTSGVFSTYARINTPHTLIKELKIHGTKRKMLQELELLIIDEVSMLRADLLDAIDTVLRHIRKKRSPFGGVQLLLIGDLFQLPPVVKEDEWGFLKAYYKNIHFFEARALQDNNLITLELNKIYRQSDGDFITLLNNLRDNALTPDDIAALNKHYHPNYKQLYDQQYIMLTTHNRKADELNRQALQNLPGKPFVFTADVAGDFNEHTYPVDTQLTLKKGAQVMFIKNDPSGEQRYFNGKIGLVKSLDEHGITVAFQDDTPPVEVERYTWENQRYSLNKGNNEIEETVIGTFSHYPLKLAWAITIHKSQGLTFEKAIIDVSGAFAPGQVYVALSRLTSLKGLVLSAPFTDASLRQDHSIREFSSKKSPTAALEEQFEKGSTAFLEECVLGAFKFIQLDSQLSFHLQSYSMDAGKSVKQKHKPWAEKLKLDFVPHLQIANKFVVQLEKILYSPEAARLQVLHQRIVAAKNHFEPILKEFSGNITSHIDSLSGEPKIKKYLSELQELEVLFLKKLQQIHKGEALVSATINRVDLTKDAYEDTIFKGRRSSEKRSVKKTKKNKHNTKEISFNLFRKGKTIEEIAEERKLVPSTIESHLAHYLALGVLDIHEIMPEEKFEVIAKVHSMVESDGLFPIKDKLGAEYSYGEIKMAVAALKYAREKATAAK